MNLLEISYRLKKLFLAVKNEILYFDIDDNLIPKEKQQLQTTDSHYNKLYTVTYKKINQIKIKGDNERELLFAVDMGANVSIYNLDHI